MAWLWSSLWFRLEAVFWYASETRVSASSRAFIAFSRGVFCVSFWGVMVVLVLEVGSVSGWRGFDRLNDEGLVRLAV